MLLDPKEIQIPDSKGVARTYILSKIPATHSREIIAQYPTSALPKIGDYSLNEAMMFKMMSYVGIPQPSGKAPLQLSTRELVDNHVPDIKMLAKLEIEMARYNWDFFLPEDLSDLKGRIKLILSTFLTQILTESLVQSSQRSKQALSNSEPSTP